MGVPHEKIATERWQISLQSYTAQPNHERGGENRSVASDEYHQQQRQKQCTQAS